MKRTLSLLLSIVMILSITAGIDLTAYASGKTPTGGGITSADSFDPLSDGYVIGEKANQFDFFETYDTIENIKAWASGYKNSDGMWASFSPKVDLFDAYAKKLGVMNSNGKANTSLSEYERVAKIYYYLDLLYAGHGQAVCGIDTAIFFRRGHCEVFADTFAELCERAGIECWVVGTENGHSWNFVKLGNKYYECDSMNGFSFLNKASGSGSLIGGYDSDYYSWVYSYKGNTKSYEGDGYSGGKTGFEKWVADGHSNLATTAYSVPSETTGLATPTVTTTATDEGIVVKWNAVANADWYEVYTAPFDGISNDITLTQMNWDTMKSYDVKYNDGDYVYFVPTVSGGDFKFSKVKTIHSIDKNEKGQYQCFVDASNVYGTVVAVVAKNVNSKTNVVTENGGYVNNLMNAIGKNYITNVTTLVDKNTKAELKYSGAAACNVNSGNYAIHKSNPTNKHSYTKVKTIRAKGSNTQGADLYECTNCLQRKIVYTGSHSHAYKTTTTNKATTSKNGTLVKKCSCGNSTKTTIAKIASVTLSKTSYTYDGKVKKPSVTVKDSKGNKISASNYTVTYADGRKNAGTYKVTIKFKGNYSGTVTKTFKIIPNATVTLSKTSFVYDGNTKKPTVTVKDLNGKKISSKNYTVTYSKGRKNVGTYTVTVKLKGSYNGTIKKTFTIKPKATTLSSVTAKSKGFTVKWKKLTTQTTGYQIQYSTDKNFAKNNKTITVSKNSTTSKTVSNLTGKKKYYVRIRTYKTVKVNGSNTKIYSSWSKAKTVTTKK